MNFERERLAWVVVLRMLKRVMWQVKTRGWPV